MTVKKKITILSLALLVLLGVTGLLQFRSIMNIANQWKQYQQTALERQVLLGEIKSQFGYGGFIHNFKNHVLRGGQKYADRFKQNKDRMDQAFVAYGELQISKEEQEALAAVKAVAVQYAKAINTSRTMHLNGSDPMAIDKIVKIDDSPAFNGFNVLGGHVKTLEKAAGESLNKTIKAMYILMSLAAVAILLFFVLFFFVLKGVGKRLALVL